LAIKAKGNNPTNMYIQSAKWNGAQYEIVFNHSELMQGGG
jgi:putative alpha-1,2-mannosidase